MVGHDWGAALAWVLAAVIPDRVEKLVAISVGHPPPSATACRSSSSREAGTCGSSSSGKWPRSSSPGTICGSSKSGQGTLPDGELYLEDLSRPGRLTVAFNWYRANIVPQRLVSPPIQLPQIKVSIPGPSASDASRATSSWRKRRPRGDARTGSGEIVWLWPSMGASARSRAIETRLPGKRAANRT